MSRSCSVLRGSQLHVLCNEFREPVVFRRLSAHTGFFAIQGPCERRSMDSCLAMASENLACVNLSHFGYRFFVSASSPMSAKFVIATSPSGKAATIFSLPPTASM